MTQMSWISAWEFQKDCEEQARCELRSGISGCKFQKYCDEQARCELNTGINMRKFQKDRDEQARCEFERVLLMNVRIVGNVFVSFALSTVDIVAMKVRQF